MLYTYSALITGVYDGDTVTCDIDLGFGIIMHEQKIRLYGIDTPEIRGSEREAGLTSRGVLLNMLSKTEFKVTLKTHKDSKGKYGRWLAELIVTHFQDDGSIVDINLNEWLVENGHARRYLV